MKHHRCYLLFLFFFCLSSIAHSQYYYSDIIAFQQAAKQYNSLVAAHVKHVSATSYEGNQPIDNFKLEQTISPDARTITITSSDPSTGDLYTQNKYTNSRLVQTKDTSTNLSSIANYTYDVAGNISTITTASEDAFMNSHSTETHQWIYDGNLPQKMLRIKDKTDTTFVTFTYDGGNVAGETWKRKGHIVETYYYYYNTKNQLTDIVRFNIRVRKMLPDFLYEYDEQGRVSQMMQVPNGSTDYMVWKYSYNNNGLKERELLYNKQQQIVGRVEYQYQ